MLANGKCSCRLTSSAGRLSWSVFIAVLKVIYVERHISWKISRNQRALQFWVGITDPQEERLFVLGLVPPGLLQEAQAGSAFAPMSPLVLRVREQSWSYWIFQALLAELWNVCALTQGTRGRFSTVGTKVTSLAAV